MTGLTLTVLVVAPPGLQLNVVAVADALAVNVELFPEHNVVGEAVGAKVGVGVTFTETVLVTGQLPALVTVKV